MGRLSHSGTYHYHYHYHHISFAAEGLAQWLRSLPPNPEVPSSIPGLIWVNFFPAKVHSAFHPSGGKMSTSIHGLISL